MLIRQVPCPSDPLGLGPRCRTAQREASASAASLAISGLSASSSYEFQVASVCSGSLSAYSASFTFTTLSNTVTCNVPAGLFANSLTASSATLNWISTGAGSYNVRYKLTTSSTWIYATSASVSKSISGLAPSSTYEFQVASVCSGGASNYSASSIFATAMTTTVVHGHNKV